MPYVHFIRRQVKNQTVLVVNQRRKVLVIQSRNKDYASPFFWFGFICLPLLPLFLSQMMFVPLVPLLGFLMSAG